MGRAKATRRNKASGGGFAQGQNYSACRTDASIVRSAQNKRTRSCFALLAVRVRVYPREKKGVAGALPAAK